MTDLELVKQYAKAWNNLYIDYIEPYLIDDFHYALQFVLQEITSKEEYTEFFKNKFENIKKSIEIGKTAVSAEIAYFIGTPALY